MTTDQSNTPSVPQSPPSHVDQSNDQHEITRLQHALKEVEQQNQLINLEYGRLLREKEVNTTFIEPLSKHH